MKDERAHANHAWSNNIFPRCIALAFLAGILISFRLWWKPSSFPSLPLISLSADPTNAFTGILLLALVGVAVNAKRIFVIAAILSTIGLMLLDQMKWQPWVYLYLVLLLPLALKAMNHQIAKSYWQLVIVGVYVWSGIHKVNPNFISGSYQEIISRFFNYDFVSTSDLTAIAGYSIGIIESATGIALLFAPARRVALVMVIAIHTVVLCFVGLQEDVRSSAILIPWNLVMVMFCFVLFYKSKVIGIQQIILLFKNGRREFVELSVIGTAIVLVWVLPVLNLVGRFDHYLSFSLFSDKPSAFYVAVRSDQFDKIPADIQQYTVKLPGMTGGEIIDVDRWARDAVRVPFYPQARTFRQLSHFFCDLGLADQSLVFLELVRKDSTKNVVHFSCGPSQ